MRVLHAASRGARRQVRVVSVRFSGRGNGAPAGEKPSGLPARLQETSVKARSPGFQRCPDHELQFGTETGEIEWSRLPQVEARLSS